MQENQYQFLFPIEKIGKIGNANGHPGTHTTISLNTTRGCSNISRSPNVEGGVLNDYTWGGGGSPNDNI